MTDQMQAVRDAVIEILRENGVKRAAFFGSIVRGGMDEVDEESDIDILIEFEGRKSLLDLAHLKNELEDGLNSRVDVLTYKSLHPRLRESNPGRILAESWPSRSRYCENVEDGSITDGEDSAEVLHD